MIIKLQLKTIIVLPVALINCLLISCSYNRETKVVHSHTSTHEIQYENEDNPVTISKEETVHSYRSSTVSTKKTTYTERTITTVNGEVSFSSNDDTNTTAFGNDMAVVVYAPPSCNCFVLKSSSGYIVVRWLGKNHPHVGDRLNGKFKSYGSGDFYNKSMRSESLLWIYNFMLSEHSAMEEVQERCD